MRSTLYFLLMFAACGGKTDHPAPQPLPPLGSPVQTVPAPVVQAAQEPVAEKAVKPVESKPATPAPAPAPAKVAAQLDKATSETDDDKPDADDAAALAELKGPLPKGVTRDTVLGGTHYRFKGSHGIVHVWVPPGYRYKTAGVVVYVHGFGTDSLRESADHTWNGFRLAEQFKESKQNALFIVPDSANSNDEPLKYAKLSGLLATVNANTHLRAPRGPLVVVGHSGAFRTVAAWLEYRGVAHVILIDGMFAMEGKFVEWMTKMKGHDGHKITLIGQRTAAGNEAFLRAFDKSQVVRLPRIPGSFNDMAKRARTARILYARSQYGHMELVTSKKVLPVILRRTPLKPL